MIKHRKASEQKKFSAAWLDSTTFLAWGGHPDSRSDNFSDLLALHEEIFKPGGGFGRHPHRHLEIYDYLIAGEFEYQDDGKAVHLLRAGDVHHISAGGGIVHAERNPSPSDDAHLVRFWIMPASRTGQPMYRRTSLPAGEKRNRLALLVSPDGADGSLPANQDARVYASILDRNAVVAYAPAPSRKTYIHLIRGAIDVDGVRLTGGDGAAIHGGECLAITGDDGNPSEFLLWDLK